jgi:hypothetical protein
MIFSAKYIPANTDKILKNDKKSIVKNMPHCELVNTDKRRMLTSLGDMAEIKRLGS